MTSIQIDIKDGLSSSVAIKGPCCVATTANITLSGEQTIDGVAVVTDERVLVKNQTTGADNGIYIADTGPWRRAKDFNKSKDIKTGTLINVTSGTAGVGWWQVSTTGDITVGTTSIAFSQPVMPYDADLAAIAALTTTAYGRSLLTMAAAENVRDSIDAAPYVATRAAMRALDTAKDTVAYFDGNNWDWTLGDYSTHVTADTIGGYYIKANAIASTVGAWKRRANFLSPKHFGAIGDDSTDDTTAVAAWFVMLMFTGHTLPGRVDGKFKITSAQTWDFSPKRLTGFLIEGAGGPNDCYFDVTDTTTSPAMYWHSNSLSLFYGKALNFGVRTNRAGVGFQIGMDSFADAWNQCTIDNVVVNNAAANAANVSLRLNQILGTYFNMVVNAGGSGKPAQPGAPGYGTAVELRQVVGCRGAIHAGNSVIGHKYTSGFSYGNTWGATNIEEVTNAIACDSASAVHNTYNGGYFVASTFLNATAGTDNLFITPNVSFYAAGSLGTNFTGWSMQSMVAGSVLTRSNATGFGVYAGGVTIDPTAHFHQYAGSGTVTHRMQTGAATLDISMTASGAFITNNVSNGPLNYTTTGASSYHAWTVNSAEIARVSSGGLTVTGVATPAANDGAALGTTALQWSDLFLASGGVLNFNNGNYTITHTAGLLTFHGAILSDNNIRINSPSSGIGYATGAGGTVTQATSKTTGVTLNTSTGQITMNAAALAAGAVVSFNAANSSVAANDIIVVNHISGGSLGSYTINARTSAGQITFDVKNTFTGSLSEAIVIAYAVIKAVIA